MRKLFQTKCVSLFCSLLLSLPAMSYAETDEMTGEEQIQTENEVPISGMVNIESQVEGYQALSVAGEQIDAAYMEESYGQRFGAIVLFHDLGQQFETRDVITPLRHELPKYGWSTLTLSLVSPIENNVMLSTKLEQNDEQPSGEASEEVNDEGTQLPEVSNEQRVQAALAFLEAKEVESVLFLGHGDGGRVAVETLSQSSLPIMGLVLVNTPELDEQQVQALTLPIFDVYGSNALSGTEKAVKKRAVEMKRNQNQSYVPRKVIGANHVFYGMDTMLTEHVRAWLKKTYQQGNK